MCSSDLRDYSFRVAPMMPDTARGPAYGAAHGLGIDPFGTHEENQGIAGPLGAAMVSLKSMIASSPAYKTPDGAKLATQAIKTLDSYTKTFADIRGRVAANDYAWGIGRDSASGVNGRLKALKSDVEALHGEVSRFIKKWQTGTQAAATIGKQQTGVEARIAKDEATWWDTYKTPVYVGAGLLATGALVYLLGPAVRNIGGRVTAPKAA